MFGGTGIHMYTFVSMTNCNETLAREVAFSWDLLKKAEEFDICYYPSRESSTLSISRVPTVGQEMAEEVCLCL